MLNLGNQVVSLRLDVLADLFIVFLQVILPLVDGTLDMSDVVLAGPHLLVDDLDNTFLDLNQRYEGVTSVDVRDNALRAEH
jgi:hypothetical protein